VNIIGIKEDSRDLAAAELAIIFGGLEDNGSDSRYILASSV